MLAETASRAQIADVAVTPPILKSAGQFRARRLNEPPVVDGRAWIAANVQATPGPVLVSTQAFVLTLEDCGDVGDFVRCKLLFRRGRAAPVRIDNDFTGWVFVTPDDRYIVTEPLFVLDVREWKQYALFDVLKIPNYVSIEAVSGDGKRLFIARRDCAIDCKGMPFEYYELTLP